MAARSGETAEETGDFRCERCHETVHVTKGKRFRNVQIAATTPSIRVATSLSARTAALRDRLAARAGHASALRECHPDQPFLDAFEASDHGIAGNSDCIG